MTQREQVQNALTKVVGNKRFTASDLNVVDLSNEQVGKAIRAQKNVKRISPGVYIVKGRKV